MDKSTQNLIYRAAAFFFALGVFLALVGFGRTLGAIYDEVQIARECSKAYVPAVANINGKEVPVLVSQCFIRQDPRTQT